MGRVQVIVQPPPSIRGLVEVMDEIRAGQQARGYVGRSPDAAREEEMARREEDAEYDRRCGRVAGVEDP